ncbi:Putative TFIIH subunit TTDA/Tfb5, TFB5-like superfamily protein [Septoria linicola]|uniref:General transcription and DNA repair factor IIH subunit TFB5 n=1 Tax=Septoria linicola TaxID=215465 RepID=A0A9Q9AXI5_9PEZI|nr:putative TFIIH subunit TTDA/Tfb5, TFB5-like superfamily protein [Septoria linicola]USW53631.1 Putative TFIIH subunit TTDA/Tfb5, TFB5-like superfamily protein [Septoria linicola]
MNEFRLMLTAKLGVLVQCDPSIKAIIVRIDQDNSHSIIIEDIDDEHVLVNAKKHDDLKALLKDKLKDTVREPEESSEEE